MLNSLFEPLAGFEVFCLLAYLTSLQDQANIGETFMRFVELPMFSYNLCRLVAVSSGKSSVDAWMRFSCRLFS